MTVHLAITGQSYKISCTEDQLSCYTNVFDMVGGVALTAVHFVPLLWLEHAVNVRLMLAMSMS